jgi:hypothetical protein
MENSEMTEKAKVHTKGTGRPRQQSKLNVTKEMFLKALEEQKN